MLLQILLFPSATAVLFERSDFSGVLYSSYKLIYHGIQRI